MASEGCGRIEETVVVLNSLHEPLGVDFEGVTVVRCRAGTPAERLAGAVPFIVRKIGDFPISKVEDLQVAVASIKSSGNFALSIQYERAYRRYEVPLEYPEQPLGLTFDNFDAVDLREQTRITGVSGPAAAVNINVGSYLRKINNVLIESGFEQAKQEFIRGREQGLRMYIISTEDTAAKPQPRVPNAQLSYDEALVGHGTPGLAAALQPPTQLPADDNQSMVPSHHDDATTAQHLKPGTATSQATGRGTGSMRSGIMPHPGGNVGAGRGARGDPTGADSSGFSEGATKPDGSRAVTLQLPGMVRLDPSLQMLQHLHPNTPPQVITAIPAECFVVPMMPPFEPSHDKRALALLKKFVENPVGSWVPGDKFELPADDFFWETFTQQCRADTTGAALTPPFARVRASGAGRRSLKVGAAYVQAYLSGWGISNPHRITAVHPGGITEFRGTDEFWGFITERLGGGGGGAKDGIAGGVLLHSSKEPWSQVAATMAHYDRAIEEWEAMKSLTQPGRAAHVAQRWMQQQLKEEHEARMAKIKERDAAQLQLQLQSQSLGMPPTGVMPQASEVGAPATAGGVHTGSFARLGTATPGEPLVQHGDVMPALAAVPGDDPHALRRGGSGGLVAASDAGSSPPRLVQARCRSCGSGRIDLSPTTAGDVLSSRALPGPASQRRALSSSIHSNAPPPTRLPQERIRKQWLSLLQNEVAHTLQRMYDPEAPAPSASPGAHGGHPRGAYESSQQPHAMGAPAHPGPPQQLTLDGGGTSPAQKGAWLSFVKDWEGA